MVYFLWRQPELVPKLRGRAVYLPMKLLWYYIMSVGMVYFGIPSAVIYSGFLGLCQYEAYMEKETEYGEEERGASLSRLQTNRTFSGV